MYLSSKDSKHLHSTNIFLNFLVEFDREIVLDDSCGFGWRQEWSFALMDISADYPNTRRSLPESVPVLCDLATNSYINGNSVGVLRIIDSDGETTAGSLHNTYYIGVNKTRLKKIRIQLKNQHLEDLDISKGWSVDRELKCILHFQKS